MSTFGKDLIKSLGQAVDHAKTPRADGGPGRFARPEELSAAMNDTRERDQPVLDYLRDK